MALIPQPATPSQWENIRVHLGDSLKGFGFPELGETLSKWETEGFDLDQAQKRIVRWIAGRSIADSRMISDQPLTGDEPDELNVEPYASAIARLINNPKTKTPLTLAINAPWGAGKSTLARLIERQLQSRNQHTIVWFNAWMHDDAPNLASAFAAEIARGADRNRVWWRRFISPLPASLQAARSPWRWVFIVCAGLAIGVALASLIVSREPGFASWVSNMVGTWLLPVGPIPVGGSALVIFFVKALSEMTSAFKPLQEFVAKPGEAASMGLIQPVRDHLGKLIGQAHKADARFIIFVDDIERCQPPRSIDVLEVVNQLLGHPGVVTIMMADMPAVAACADIKYKKLARSYVPTGHAGGSRAYGQAYLQKMIQLQFDMPSHPRETVEALIDKLVANPGLAGGQQAKAPEEKKREVSAPGLVGGVSRTWAQGYLPLADISNRWKQSRFPRKLAVALVFLLELVPRLVASWVDREVYPRPKELKTFWPGANWNNYSRAMDWSLLLLFMVFVGSLLVMTGYSTIPAYSARPLQWVAAGARQHHALAWMVALAIPAMAFVGFAWARSSSQKEADDRVKAAVSQVVSKLGGQVSQVTADVRDSVVKATGWDVDADFIQEEMSFTIADESQLREDAEQEIRPFLPSLPRNAKRIINRLRLFLLIASERQMFANGNISPREIGKWALLCESWPDLAEDISLRPSLMAELENAAENSSRFVDFAKSSGIEHYVHDESLRRFCSTGVALGGKIEKLIHFQP